MAVPAVSINYSCKSRRLPVALFIDTSKNHRTVGALLTGLSMVVILTAGDAYAQSKPIPSSQNNNREFGLSDLLRSIFGGPETKSAMPNGKAKPTSRASRGKPSVRGGVIKYGAGGRATEVPVVDVRRGRIPQSWDREYYLEKAEAKKRARARDVGV